MTPRIAGLLCWAVATLVNRLFGLVVELEVFVVVVAVAPFYLLAPGSALKSWRQFALLGVACYAVLAVLLLMGDRSVYSKKPLVWAFLGIGAVAWSAGITRLVLLSRGGNQGGGTA